MQESTVTTAVTQGPTIGLQNRTPGKLLGDAGEHYALSQFSFAGRYDATLVDEIDQFHAEQVLFDAWLLRLRSH